MTSPTQHTSTSRQRAPGERRTWPQQKLKPYPDGQSATVTLSSGYAASLTRFNVTQDDARALFHLLGDWLRIDTKPVIRVTGDKVDPQVLAWLGVPQGKPS